MMIIVIIVTHTEQKHANATRLVVLIHQSLRETHLPVVSKNFGDRPTRYTFYVRDRMLGKRFLVDTGAEVSSISLQDPTSNTVCPNLVAANDNNVLCTFLHMKFLHSWCISTSPRSRFSAPFRINSRHQASKAN